jgi:hypothetical protein
MSRAASRRDHQRFCEIEGWSVVRNARGKPTQHHLTYELALPDGRILRTRVSRPANTDAYGPSLWGHILDDQLAVTADEFWDCVDNGTVPGRARTAPAVPPAALPAGLVYQLVHTLGLGADEVEGMTQEEAVQRLTAHWSQPHED